MDKKTLEMQIKLLADEAVTQLKTFSEDIKKASAEAKSFTGNAEGINKSIQSLQSEANRASNSLKLFGGSATELKNTTQKMKSTILDLIDGGLEPESEEIQNLVQQYKKLDEQVDKTGASQDGLFGIIGQLKNEISSLATVAAAVELDKALVSVAKDTLEVSDSFQAAKDEFGIMLGDMQAGAGLFDELQKFNFWTPFDIEQTSQAAKVLMSAKVPLAEITNYLTRFGDISQGNGQKFQSFINAFSKASAKGKADMEVLNVYIDQGVQILDALGEQLGISSAEVTEFASKGKISFEIFDAALASLAEEGGLYYNSMATAAMRLSAVQAGLEESVKSLKASFGDMLAPEVSNILTLFTSIVDVINNSPILKGVLLAAITSLTLATNALAFKAIGALIAQLPIATMAVTAFKTAIKALQGPIGWITLAIGAVVGVLVTYKSHQQKVNEETNAAALALHKQAQGYDEVKRAAEETLKFLSSKSVAEAEEVLKTYTESILPLYVNGVKRARETLANTPATITKEYDSWTDKGKKTKVTQTIDNPEYTKAKEALAEAEAELQKYQAEADSAREIIEGLKKSALDAIASFGTEWQDKLASRTEKIDEEEKKSLEKLKKKAIEILGEKYSANEAYQKELAALEKYYTEKRLDKIREENEKLLKEKEKAQQTINKILNSGLSPEEKIKQEYKEQLNELRRAAAQLYGDNFLTQKDYIDAEYTLRRKAEEEIASLEEKNHKTRLQMIQEEAEKRAQEAAKQINSGNGNLKTYASLVGNTAVATAASEVSNTDLGGALSSSSGFGVGVLIQFIKAIAECLMKIESINKILNFAKTIVEAAFSVFGDIINDGFKPTARALERIGTIIGKILAPLLNIINLLSSPLNAVLNIIIGVLNLLGEAFEWLNNKVIVPIGNKFIDIINAVIGALNKLPFVEIDYLEKLKLIGDEAEEVSESLEEAKKAIEETYEALKTNVQDRLNAEISSLQKQLELGLITRAQYEAQRMSYQLKAESEIVDLEKEMKDVLEEIAKNTENINLAKINSDAASKHYSTQYSGASGYVSSSSGSAVNIYVSGSVVSQKELEDVVYDGISRSIRNGSKTPFPQSA